MPCDWVAVPCSVDPQACWGYDEGAPAATLRASGNIRLETAGKHEAAVLHQTAEEAQSAVEDILVGSSREEAQSPVAQSKEAPSCGGNECNCDWLGRFRVHPCEDNPNGDGTRCWLQCCCRAKEAPEPKEE